jgi:hypothetical protein
VLVSVNILIFRGKMERAMEFEHRIARHARDFGA